MAHLISHVRQAWSPFVVMAHSSMEHISCHHYHPHLIQWHMDQSGPGAFFSPICYRLLALVSKSRSNLSFHELKIHSKIIDFLCFCVSSKYLILEAITCHLVFPMIALEQYVTSLYWSVFMVLHLHTLRWSHLYCVFNQYSNPASSSSLVHNYWLQRLFTCPFCKTN